LRDGTGPRFPESRIAEGDERLGVSEPLRKGTFGPPLRDAMPFARRARVDGRDDERAQTRAESVLVDADANARRLRARESIVASGSSHERDTARRWPCVNGRDAFVRAQVDVGGMDEYGTPLSNGPKTSATVKEPAMNKLQLKKFKTLLTEKRDEIVKKAKQTLEEDMALDANDLPDEMDLASSEYLQSFTFRLRGREKAFLEKIQKALTKIDEGNFGVCEECAEEISIKRLEARPETTLCIRCKEDQERMEKDYS
jgi:DnaK suppressor protein